MPSNSSTAIHRLSAGAGAGPKVPVSDTKTSPTLETPHTTAPYPSPPVSVTFQHPRYILLPPRHGQQIVAPSGLPPHDSNNHTSATSVAQQQQSRSVIRRANVLANWTSSTGRSPTTSGIVTRSSHFSSTRSIPFTANLNHSISTRAGSSRLSSGSSDADLDSPIPPRTALTREMPNTYFPLHLSTSDPLRAIFKGSDGRTLYSTSTNGRTTVIRRLYGRSAQTTKLKQDGLILAEIEWMDRVRSSRIRFKGTDVDVRIDEFLKETRGGSGQSRMFATSDGRTYKWKAGSPGDSAELFECAAGKRISGLLASSKLSTSSSSGLPTPPPTPPIILAPSPPAARVAVAPSSPQPSSASAGRIEVPSISLSEPETESIKVPIISLSEPETRQEGEKPTLWVHTSVLTLVDQIVVTWVIMDRDRSMHKKN